MIRSSERRFALAVVVIAGLALVATCPRLPWTRDEARQPLRELYRELGRQHLLAGDAERAVVYLSEAYAGAEDDAGLRFLVARAVEALRREAPRSDAGQRYTAGPRTVRLRRNWPQSRASISSADLDDGWTRVVALDGGGEAAIFDPRDGRLLVRLTGAPETPVSVRFSPDGEQVAGLHGAGRFSLWASATGEIRLTAELPLGRALETTALRAVGPAGRDVAGLAMAFSADGRRLATSASDGFTRIWDTADGAGLASFETGPVTTLDLDPGGRRLVAAGDRFATIWKTETGLPIVSLDLPRDAAPARVVYSPDGRRILAAGRPPEVRLFDAANGELDAFLVGSKGSVCCAAFSPDGALIATAGDDGVARIWDAKRGQLLDLLPLPGRDAVHAEYGPRGARIATVHADGTLDVQAVPLDEAGATEVDRLRNCLVPWRLAHRELGRLVPATPDPAACGLAGPAFERSEPSARTAPSNPTPSKPAPSRPAPSKPQPPPLRAQTPVSGRVVDASGRPIPGAQIRLWAEGSPLLTLRHGAPLAAASFSADGRRVLTVADDGGARVWDLETGQPASAPVAGEAPGAAAFSVSPDGKSVATLSRDVARIWEAGTGRPLGEPLRHDGAVRSVAFSPDGRWLLTASRDGAARLWQVPGSSDAESMLALVRPLAFTDTYGQVRFEIDRIGPQQKLLVSYTGYETPAVQMLPSNQESLAFVAKLAEEPWPSLLRVDTQGSAASSFGLTYFVLKDADLVETIRSLARLFGLDVVLAPEVRGTISAELPGGGLEETFGKILAAYGLVYESSGGLTLVFAEERTLPPESEILRGGRLKEGEPISMSLKDANLFETLRSFGSIFGGGLMIDPDVSGLVSAELEGVPWDRALVALLRVHDLELEVSGNYWRIRRRLARGVP